MYYNRDPKGCGCLAVIYLIIFLISFKIVSEEVVFSVVLSIFLLGFLCVFIYSLYEVKKEENESKESDEKKGKENNQNQQISSYSSNDQKERLNSLLDSFHTYISKPFPDRHLNYNNPYFDELYRLIAKIKGYDFKCGYEKEQELSEKIKAHNKTIANRFRLNRTSSAVC